MTDIGDDRIKVIVTPQAPSKITTTTIDTTPHKLSKPPISTITIITPSSNEPPSNQPCRHEPSTTKFPLLHLLGIETNFNTQKNTTLIETLLAEVVALHNSSGKD